MLLQAAMMAGYMLFIGLCVFLIVGVPLLTALLMRSYWKIRARDQNDFDKQPFYKEPLPYLVSIIISIVILFGVFCLLIVILDKIFPNVLYYS